MPNLPNYSRRRFLTATGLTAGAAGLGLLPGNLVGAEAVDDKARGLRNPWIYHFKIGDIDAWSISDGHMKFRQGLKLMYPEAERGAMAELLKQQSEPLDYIPLYINVLVIKRGKEVAVFDAGFGGKENSWKGWFHAGLKKIGIKLEQVTATFLSHGHVDHIQGFVADGKPAFKNAALYVTPEEFNFWRAKSPDLSLTKRNQKGIPGMVAQAREALEILSPNKQLTKVGSSLLGGAVTIENGFGHTPGHALYRIKSGDDELLHIVDLVHHHLLMFQDPNWSIGLDNIPKLAVETRKKVFAQAAAQQTRTYGFHLPFPGLGHVGKQGAGYQWIPERLTWD